MDEEKEFSVTVPAGARPRYEANVKGGPYTRSLALDSEASADEIQRDGLIGAHTGLLPVVVLQK